jgi:DNA topoisomerase-1
MITRQKRGKGFVYQKNGSKLEGPDTLKWIKSLAIPPAWTEVEINENKNGKVLASGRDDAGRLQSIYNPAFRAKMEREKYSRMLDFASKLPRLRKQIEHDLSLKKFSKSKVVACVVKLIDEAYFRVGNVRYAKQNDSYGITTMRSKHVDITGYSVTFDFIGKSDKRHVKKISDARLAKIIKQLDEMPGHEIFRYKDEQGRLHNVSSADVNEYIKTYMGEEFTAKDFRTWAGTLKAVELLAQEKIYKTKKERSKAITSCVKMVAKRLGNTPAVTKSSYIDPDVFKKYLGGEDFSKIRAAIKSMKAQEYVTPEESCALNILQAAK